MDYDCDLEQYLDECEDEFSIYCFMFFRGFIFGAFVENEAKIFWEI